MSSVPTLVPLALPTVMVVESVLAPPVIVVDAVELALVSDPNRRDAFAIERRVLDQWHARYSGQRDAAGSRADADDPRSAGLGSAAVRPVRKMRQGGSVVRAAVSSPQA
jgi:hypothetical protein